MNDGNTIAIIVSSIAAAVSAISALLSFIFSRKMSRREMLDIMKIQILQLVSSKQGRDEWVQIAAASIKRHGLPMPREFIDLLGTRYNKKKWHRLFLPAVEELKREGYGHLLPW